MEEFTSAERFWLRAFPCGALVIGGTLVVCLVSNVAINAYQCVQVASIKAGIVRSVVDGAVTIVQTIVGGFTQ